MVEEKGILRKAIEEGDFKTIRKEMLINPQAYQIRDEFGRTMLHSAFEVCKKCDRTCPDNVGFYSDVIIKILKIFIGVGLNIDARAGDGKTALWLAVELQMLKVAQFLVDHGANVKVTNRNRDNLIIVMVRSIGSFPALLRPEFCYQLIKMGIDVDSKNENGQTAYRLSIEQQSTAIAKVLALHTKEINFVNDQGKSIAHMIVDRDEFDEQCARKLAKNGLRFNVIDNNGRTPLHYAARRNIVLGPASILLDNMTDINLRDTHGNTALHYAARYPENVDFCETLIKQGVDIYQKGRYNLYPVQIAALYHNVPLLRILRDRQVQFDISTTQGATLFHFFAGLANRSTKLLEALEIVDVLLFKGCSTEASLYHNGQTPLHVAVQYNNIGVVDALLLRGANVNAKDKYMSTPLHIAARAGLPETLALLISGGAEVNVKNSSDRLPLEIALSNDNVAAVQYFLRIGAKVNDIAVTESQMKVLEHIQHRSRCWRFVEKYCVMLKVIDLPIASPLCSLIIWESKHIEKSMNKYIKEMQFLKIYEVEENKSLLDVLKLSPSRRYKYGKILKSISNDIEFENLRRLIPLYTDFIVSSMNEAIERKNLQRPAFEALYRLTKIKFPDICVDLIQSYLSNIELKILNAV